MALGKLIFNVFLFVLSVGILNVAEAYEHGSPVAVNSARFDNLLDRMDKMEAQGTLLQAENEDLKRHILFLEATVAQQQGEITDLKYTIDEQTETNHQLHERLLGLEGKDKPIEQNRLDRGMLNTYNRINGLLKTQNESHAVPTLEQKTMKDGKSQKRVLETGMPRIARQENEVSVAFFARLDSHINNPGVHQIIAFDHVITNIGNGYNSHAGDFRAPVAGIYVFSTTLMAGIETTTYHFQVAHNGQRVSNIYIQNGGTSTQDVVLQLNQGDDVSIHNVDAGKKVYGAGYSCFSGFLLQEHFSNTAVVGK